MKMKFVIVITMVLAISICLGSFALSMKMSPISSIIFDEKSSRLNEVDGKNIVDKQFPDDNVTFVNTSKSDDGKDEWLNYRSDKRIIKLNSSTKKMDFIYMREIHKSSQKNVSPITLQEAQSIAEKKAKEFREDFDLSKMKFIEGELLQQGTNERYVFLWTEVSNDIYTGNSISVTLTETGDFEQLSAKNEHVDTNMLKVTLDEKSAVDYARNYLDEKGFRKQYTVINYLDAHKEVWKDKVNWFVNFDASNTVDAKSSMGITVIVNAENATLTDMIYH